MSDEVLNSQQEEELQLEDKEKKKVTDPLDNNYPLLKEFRRKAAGSHKHTQSLVSMVENVCAAIDLDPIKLKTAATYHDIGKMLSPHLFTENQGSENIHDDLPPWVSFHLISRHVSDSVMILVANDFPVDVIKIASQHHGTCVMKAIYEKAHAQDPNVDEDLFRYQTSRPDCLESLILMMCDQLEAASRSIYVQQGKDADPTTLVGNIYNKLHLDGQFDNVTVQLGRLKRIQDALITDVASNFQKRVPYDEDEELVEDARRGDDGG